MAKEVFGIDLGTTNSCIAEISPLDKLPIIIKNSDDLQTTPSVVYYDDYGSPIVGGEAKRCMVQDPSRTVAFIKREMSNPSYKRTIGTETISPVKISAMILKKLVDDANLSREYRGKTKIKDVVITVPAYFGNNERELTKQAGEVAGLNVLALLNEPTAAALSYGTSHLEGKKFMVYDLGGGTFDVSIMQMRNGCLETLSTDGDHHLGGMDWDIELVNYVLSSCCGTSDRYDNIKHTRDGGALILAAEQCKKLLSKNEESPMRFRYKNRMYTKPIKRSLFEELTSDLLQRTIDVVRHAMAISTNKYATINEIILPINTPAGGVRISKDLASRSYGVGVIMRDTNEEKIQNLILRTDSIVYSGTATTCTKNEGQKDVYIAIYENISVEQYVERNQGKQIAAQTINWGHPVPKDTDINYVIKRGSDGIVHIEVECQGHKIFFDIKPDQALSDYEKFRLKREIDGMQL